MTDWIINFANTYLVPFGLKIVLALVVLFVGLKVVKFLTNKIGKKALAKVDSSVGGFILSAVRVTLNILIVIIAVQILGVPSATIIAAIGSCGLALGLALQGGLSNLAGGVMIMLFKPFKIGDYIVSGSGEGVVEDINLFYTRLCTVDNKSVNIPNSALSSSTVTNLSAKETRGIDIPVDIAYGADMDAARKALLDCARSCGYVLDEPAPIVFVADHCDSSLKLTLRATVKGADYWPARFELMENTVKALQSANVKIPFPQLDVHMY